MTIKRLSDEDRRKMILEALAPGASQKAIAEKYGVLRGTLYQHINRVMRDPEGQMKKAEAEASFRRQVYELTR